MITLPGVIIHSKIYESSASLVYRGMRERENCAVIAKVLKQDYPSSQELTRYRQEYEITRSLNIEGVVKAYSQQDYQRTLFILLEDFGGESLEHWMRQQSDFCPMPLPTFLGLAIALTDTLGRIHVAHVIHKDISPGNIVLNPNTGVVKIIDFGIATRFSRTNPTFKSLHLLEGTPAYLSPEQTGRMNRMLDYRTDFYSLGATFYELLTGQLPFPTSDLPELVHCHIATPPIPPHELNATIPKPISDLVLKLIAKNAEDRYQSAWGIKADLERYAEQLAEVGLIEPMLLGLQDVSEQFCIPQKLYGREAEIEALLAAFDRVVATDFVTDEANDESVHCAIQSSASSVSHPLPMMMLVSGYAGVGKTALVQELSKPITAKHGYFIWGKFDQFRRNLPYSAIVDALQKWVQQLLGEPDEQVELWRSRLLTALGSNGQVIVDVIPEVELIIGKQPPVPEVGATEAQNRFNLTFQRFVRVFCAKEHPLVIFLDDLQWIDSATLKLIELILLDEQTQYLFLIGAYRDNEVSPTHSLILMLESLRNQGAALQEITLTPLTLEPLAQLVAETLHHHPDTVRSLAQVVLRKTEGNPFFVGEFLKLLYGENLLTFDPPQSPLSKGGSKGGWQWNLAEIEAQEITDNVVELLLHQLQKLPEATQKILSIAACVGSEFDLETLAIVLEKSPKSIFQDLLAAIQAGLIQPLSNLDKDLLVQEYKFLHDRVQQAAYALIDPSQKPIVHLQIGRNLLEKTAPEQLSDRLFEIVDHLNYGIELVSDQAERDEIAKLNLLAGQRAKGAIAYSTARNYLTTGRQWLAASSWQTNYDLTLELYVETTEVAYLCGEFEQVEYWAEIVLQSAKTIFDSVKVYEVRIQTDIAQNQSLKAINTALQVLQKLGINFPTTPSQSDICLELDTITALFNEKEVESLIDLPEMTEPSKLAAMRILSSITIAAQIAVPNLIPLLAAKQVNLSIQYGNAFVSPLAYATFGLILCGMIGNIETGYQFGQLALKLLSQPHTHALKARTLVIVNDFIIHWKKHTRELLQPLLEGYQIGLETGDLESAAYCAHTHCCQFYVTGKELVEVKRDMVTYGEAIHHIKQETALTWNQIFRQVVINLMGGSIDSTRLIGESYNEEIELPQYEAANDGSTILSVHFNKLFLCYLFSKYAQAVENAALAETYLIRLTGTTLEPLYYLYDSLARLATYSGSSTQVRSEILKKVAVSQEKMKHWAYHAPMNYLHKYHLVEAETARVLGQLLEAEEFYEQAIQGAKDNEYLQEEALAYELAAKHYLARGRSKIAQTYMKEAHYCYDRWGAKAKVKDLETRYPQLLNTNLVRQSHPIVTDETIRHSTAAIDLAAVMKAAQALSEIIHLDQLIATLMQVVIENAGAETGALILLEDDQLTVVAQCSGSRQCDLEKIAVAGCATIPVSVIHSAERTQETLVFDDAVSEPSFLTDPYIQNQQTRSLLCMPILKQSQLIGILYLENNLSTGVFTSDRLQVLKLLIAQAAISLENARLYQQLENYAETLERKVEERTQALQQEICERQAALRERKRTEESLLESEQLLNLFFSQSLDGFFIMMLDQPVQWNNSVDKDQVLDYIFEHQRVTKINDAMLAQYRASREQFIGITPNDTFAHDLAYGKDVWRRLFDAGKLHIETDERRLDGTVMWVEGYYICLYDSQGRLIGHFGVQRDVSEAKRDEVVRQQAEEALQRSETKFRNIFENSQVGIFRARLSDGLILDANQCFANLFGFDSPEEVIGLLHGVDCYVSPSDRQRAIELLNRDGQLQNFEVQLQRRDGTLFWALYSARPNVADECMEGVIADISDRVSAEAALRKSEQLLDVSFSQSLDGFFIMMLDQPVQWDDSVDKDQALDYVFAHQRVTKANDAMLAQYGMSQEQFIGFTPNDLYAHDLTYGKRVWREFLDAGKLCIETDERRSDGTAIWIEGNYICLYDSQGRLIGHFGVQRDISERKRIEDERKQAEAALQTSETKLRTLIKAIPDPLFVLSAEGRFLEIIVLDANLLWQPFEEMIGQTLHQLGKEQADEFLSYIQQVLRTQQILTVEYSAFLNGREAWFSARIAPISHDQVIWLSRDITALKQAEEASILEERNRMAREIHDTLAQAFTGILIQVDAATQVLTDDVEATQAHLDTIEELARTGLSEARRSVTALRPQLLEEGDLSSALERLVNQMRVATNTALIYSIQGVAYSLPAEVENNLLRIGQEALTNAIKYANANEIRIELVYDDTQCRLQIKDDGQGFGVVGVPMSGGFGLLGMSERAERIGAQLAIESQPGQGTEIIVIVNRG